MSSADRTVAGPGALSTSAQEIVLPSGVRRQDIARWQRPAVVSNVVLVLFGVFFLVPLLWFLLSSLDSINDNWGVTFAQTFSHLTLGNFRAALANGGLLSLGNSLLLAGTAMVVSTLTAATAAYALSRRRIPWKGPLLLVVLFLTGIPLSIIVIPIYQMYVVLGWLSIVPCALFLAVTSLPFQIWMLKNYFDALPVEIEEAATVEGASTYQILRRVVIPSALPGFGATAIFGFVNAWSSFIVPLVLISSANEITAPINIYSYIGASHVDYGALAAFSVFYSLPVLVLYLAMSRLFKGGFVLSGSVVG
jgi:multiple sugar transport system permease protein